MVNTDNAKSKREICKLSKTMGDKLDKDKGRIEELEAPGFRRNASTEMIQQRTVEKELITAPPLPIPAPVQRATTLPLSKLALFAIIVVLALLPCPALAVQSDVLIVLTVASTYVLPTVLHIIVHNFRALLSIILPTGQGSPSGNELLRRKERMLQRRRLGCCGGRLLLHTVFLALVTDISALSTTLCH
ncbi:hypothetical protein K488DRAFT_91697 [Vararia minispora EC-137]|uniref:Uncharacterized protein n=1 Tax=Vararia minispora EC-137 TaxID=1314806 RepID=A0ACB8Q572_9AGAM|nr:hypothetical protein K488DRAFT_91697 [Vararia minispora EC-137]